MRVALVAAAAAVSRRQSDIDLLKHTHNHNYTGSGNHVYARSGREGATCPGGYVASSAATATLLVACIAWIASGLRSEAIIGARRFINFSGMIQTLVFTMVIPCSLKLARQLGGNATTSGWLISAQMGGLGVGSFIVWIFNNSTLDGSVKSMRAFNFVGAALSLLGMGAFALMSWYGINVWALVGARFVTGIGLGLVYFAGRFFINRTALGKEIAEVNMTWALWFVFGLGFGPALAAGESATFRAVCGLDAPVGRGAEFIGMFQCALFLLIAAFMFPSSEDLHDRIPQAQPPNEEDPSTTQHPHKLTICCCFLFHAIRNFSIASLEAATAQLLEDKYLLDEITVGLLISITFLLTIPLKLLFDRLRDASTRAISIRVLMAICVIGAVLLREDVGHLLAGESRDGKVAVIISADLLFFPALFLTGAIVEGVAFRLASPEGTLFSTNNCSLAMAIIGNSFGWFLGPPTARAIIDTASGQTSYALQQLTVGVVALLTIEIQVMGELHQMDTDFEVNIMRTSKEKDDEKTAKTS